MVNITLFTVRFTQALKQICYESAEHVLQCIADKFIVYMESRRFVHQRRSGSAPITKNTFEIIMIHYLDSEYNLSVNVWQHKRKQLKIQSSKLPLSIVAAVFGVDVVSKTFIKTGWKVFIAEPIIVWERQCYVISCTYFIILCNFVMYFYL